MEQVSLELFVKVVSVRVCVGEKERLTVIVLYRREGGRGRERESKERGIRERRHLNFKPLRE